MKKQCDRVMDYLKNHDGITAFEAMTELGIMRLASRISDLRHEGYPIIGKTVSVTNRFGETCCVKRYSLEAK